MKWIIALLVAAAVLYMWNSREGFMPSSKDLLPCPGDHISTSGPRYIHTSSGDCKLSTHVHDPR